MAKATNEELREELWKARMKIQMMLNNWAEFRTIDDQVFDLVHKYKVNLDNTYFCVESKK